jgi:hypothetical protein
MAAAFQQGAVMPPCCVQWDLPSGPLRLSTAGFFSFIVDGAGATFRESDPTFGRLAGIGEISDGISDEAPVTTFVLLPPSTDAMAALVAPETQDTRVRIWNLTLDPVLGTVLGTPELWLRGRADAPVLTVDEGVFSLSVDARSVLDRALRPNEAAKLNNGWHQRCRPGELGFQFISSVNRSIPWGSDTPVSPLNTAQAAAYARLYNTPYYGV